MHSHEFLWLCSFCFLGFCFWIELLSKWWSLSSQLLPWPWQKDPFKCKGPWVTVAFQHIAPDVVLGPHLAGVPCKMEFQSQGPPWHLPILLFSVKSWNENSCYRSPIQCVMKCPTQKWSFDCGGTFWWYGPICGRILDKCLGHFCTDFKEYPRCWLSATAFSLSFVGASLFVFPSSFP